MSDRGSPAARPPRGVFREPSPRSTPSACPSRPLGGRGSRPDRRGWGGGRLRVRHRREPGQGAGAQRRHRRAVPDRAATEHSPDPRGPGAGCERDAHRRSGSLVGEGVDVRLVTPDRTYDPQCRGEPRPGRSDRPGPGRAAGSGAGSGARSGTGSPARAGASTSARFGAGAGARTALGAGHRAAAHAPRAASTAPGRLALGGLAPHIAGSECPGAKRPPGITPIRGNRRSTWAQSSQGP